MTNTYDDGTIVCGPDQLEIHFYYFPYGTKDVSYARIKGLRRIELRGPLSGSWRIWGTGNFRYWANLDWRRPRKKIGFVVDVGRRISPVITPDDPDAFESALRARTNLGPNTAPEKGPFI